MLKESRISSPQYEGEAFYRDFETPLSDTVRVSSPGPFETKADVIFLDRTWPLQQIEFDSDIELVRSIKNDKALEKLVVSAIVSQFHNSMAPIYNSEDNGES